MGGANAIRMKNDTESMRAMLLDPSDGKLEEMTTAQALAGMFGELAKVPLENIQFYVMPGEAAKKGNDTYYSIHKADLAALLQEHFNPYGAAITEGAGYERDQGRAGGDGHHHHGGDRNHRRHRREILTSERT